jgi:hypothetical protein
MVLECIQIDVNALFQNVWSRTTTNNCSHERSFVIDVPKSLQDNIYLCINRRNDYLSSIKHRGFKRTN